MNKKELKEIEITGVIKHHLSCTQDYSGEYETRCNIDFLLNRPIWFQIFDKEYRIDRINMSCQWDDTVLQYAQEGKVFCCFPVAKTIVHKVMNRVIEEQKTGVMQGWRFEESFIEVLQGENNMTHCYY